MKRYKKLPTTPTKKDLEAVATKLLAMRWNPIEEKWNGVGHAPHPDFVNLVVGYALTCRMRLPAVANTVEEARYQARKHNRLQILATDIRAALLDYQIPSDEALQQAFQPIEKRQELTIQTVARSFAPGLQRRCTPAA